MGAEPDLFAAVTRYFSRGVAFVVAFAAGLVPFLVTYLPILQQQGGRKYATAVRYAAHPADIVNVGASNLLWGHAVRALFGVSYAKRSPELAFGLTPVLGSLLALAVVFFGYRVIANRARRTMDVIAFTTAAVGAIMILLPVQAPYGLPWRLVWLWVPGAQAIRAIDRIGVMAVFFGCLSVAFLLRTALTPSPSSRTPRKAWMRVAVVVLAVLALEQLNVAHGNNMDRRQELAQLRAVPAATRRLQSLLRHGSDARGARILRHQHRRDADIEPSWYSDDQRLLG